MKSKLFNLKFDNYQTMSQGAKNWDIHCAFQLLPCALNGEHSVSLLPNIQLSFSWREGGFMHDAISPPDSFSIAVVQESYDKACFERIKLHPGDIVFFDDSTACNFMSYGEIKVAIVSIPNHIVKSLGIDTKCFNEKYIRDTDDHLSTELNVILKQIKQPVSNGQLGNEILDSQLQKIEDHILSIITELVQNKNPLIPKLSKGEEIALKIRDKVYRHMDGKVSIKAYAQEYQISEQTLQNSFKSLFGMAPNRFLRLLKLNLVHHDLKKNRPETASVSKLAYKWGFTHMGHFSRYYQELYNEKPSETLKVFFPYKNGMSASCVSRQEEA